MSEHPYADLPGLLFGELDRAQVTAVSDHLATCDDCRRELAVLAATSASLRATARNAQALPEAGPGVAAAEGAPAVQPHRVGRSTAAARPAWPATTATGG